MGSFLPLLLPHLESMGMRLGGGLGGPSPVGGQQQREEGLGCTEKPSGQFLGCRHLLTKIREPTEEVR